MGRDELIALAKQTALMHNLDGALMCAICEQESAWNPWSLRYESAFFDKYVAPQNLPSPTEARARAFSWGLCQVMGQTAREHGYMGLLTQLCDPMIGMEWGCTVFSYKLTKARLDVARALSLWNGGGNPNYPAEVLARMHNYQ